MRRTISWVAIALPLLALTACTASQQYQSAAHRVEWAGTCWVPSHLEYLGGDCASENNAIVQGCIGSLAAASRDRPPLATAMQRLEICMADAGYKPVAAIPFHPDPPPQCGDDEAFDRCPSTERDTQR